MSLTARQCDAYHLPFAEAEMGGIGVPIPVPMAFHSFGG